ncbi:MAG: tyrosine-type recombinase/integrase [Rhodobacteraceae bacterium]|nr:tyrosine-type recombinase/integrase [Paracoccaceae bacterium]MCZ8084999.1 tyrosine-type recombinase/integrase [Paracoccaceae bacterium]
MATVKTNMGVVNRSGHWHLRYVVPKRYRGVEPRSQIWISLKTDSEKEARRMAAEIERDLTSRLEARLLSGGQDAGQIEERYKAVVATAHAMGLSYVQAGALLDGDPAELVRRLNVAAAADPEAKRAEVADAALGVVSTPELMLSSLAAKVEQIAAHENRHKNARQMADWKNNMRRSLGTLQKALGRDVPVLSIGVAEARLHRRFLQGRIEKGEISAETAGKDLTYASGALRRYYDHLALAEPPRPYAGVTIRDRFEKESRKQEMPEEWIRDVLLTPGRLDGMNSEARDALLVILETGCRQSEVLDLPPEDIHLDAPVPFFELRHVESGATGDGVGREVKNSASERKVPLVGVALAAMKRHPHGFPSYRAKDTFSATVNKFLRENGLLPDGLTVGGLRHSWESRLKRAGYDNEDRAEMMGHSMKVERGREVYGDEAALARRAEIARAVAFDVPDPFAAIGTQVMAKPRKRKGAT